MKQQDEIRKIDTIILDIDGVLTNGTFGYDGTREIKFFNARDGHGIKLAKRAGLRVGALSGRGAEANRVRAAELGFDFLYEDIKDKRQGFANLLAEHGLEAAQCLYMGDDVVDIPVLAAAGVAATVADAADGVPKFCDWQSTLPGGRGAVREMIEWLLKAQGKWETLMERYTLG